MIVGPGAKYESGLGIPYHAVATPFKYTACDGNEYVYVGTFSNISLRRRRSMRLAGKREKRSVC